MGLVQSVNDVPKPEVTVVSGGMRVAGTSATAIEDVEYIQGFFTCLRNHRILPIFSKFSESSYCYLQRTVVKFLRLRMKASFFIWCEALVVCRLFVSTSVARDVGPIGCQVFSAAKAPVFHSHCSGSQSCSICRHSATYKFRPF